MLTMTGAPNAKVVPAASTIAALAFAFFAFLARAAAGSALDGGGDGGDSSGGVDVDTDRYGEPYCFRNSNLCPNSDPPSCSPFAGICKADGNGCFDGFGEEVTCDAPENHCLGRYCNAAGGRYFCAERTAGDCAAATCLNLQREECPESLADGECGRDGSGCPPTFVCERKTTRFSRHFVHCGYVRDAGGDGNGGDGGGGDGPPDGSGSAGSIVAAAAPLAGAAAAAAFLSSGLF